MKIIAAMAVKDELRFICDQLRMLENLADEIVLVDDGSTDGTLEVIRAHPKVTGLICKPPGCKREEVKNWNLLIDLARRRGADWILFNDCDTFFEPAFKEYFRQVTADPAVGKVTFRLLTMWRSMRQFRLDRPEKFIPMGENLTAPLLVRMTPGLRWRLPSHGLRRLYHILAGKVSYRKAQLARGALLGVEGRSEYADRLVVLHYSVIDWPRYLRKQLGYLLHARAMYPKKKAEDLIVATMQMMDDTDIVLKEIREDWIWDFQKGKTYIDAEGVLYPKTRDLRMRGLLDQVRAQAWEYL